MFFLESYKRLGGVHLAGEKACLSSTRDFDEPVADFSFKAVGKRMRRISREEQYLFIAASVIQKEESGGGGGGRFSYSALAAEENISR